MATTIQDLLIGLGFEVDDSGLAGLDQTIGRIKKGLTAFAVGAGAAVAAGLHQALGTFGDFEEQLNKVGALADATGAQMEAMKEQALELGASTKFSATEAAAGMGELASAGLNASDIMAAMPGTLDLAASAAVSVGQAAEVAGQMMGGFGLKATDLGHAADVLAKAAGMSQINLSDLQNTMKYIAPMAKAAGQSLEEMAGLTAVMGTAGIKSEQAGTSLRASLIALIKPSTEAAKLMAGLGLAVADQAGNVRPMRTILDDLRKKTAGMGQAQRLAAVSTIFGAEAASGMLAILNKSPHEVKDFTNAMYHADGAAKKMADRMNKGYNAAIRELMGAIETLSIRIGERLAPTIQRIAGHVRDFTNMLSSNKGLLDGFSKGLEGLRKAALWAAVAFATFKLGAFIAAIPGAIQQIGALAIALNGVGVAGALAAAGPYLLAAALVAIGLMLQDFYVWMEGGEAALGGWFDTWYKVTYDLISLAEGGVANLVAIWDGFTAGLYELGYESQGILLSVGQAFSGFFGALGQLASMGMAALGTAIQAGMAGVAGTFTAVFSGIRDTVAAFVAGIVARIGDIPNAIRNALAAFPGIGQAAQSLGAIAPGPRPAIAGAGGGYGPIQNSTHVSVTVPPGTTNPAAIARATAGAAGNSTRDALARGARQQPRPMR